MFQKKCKSARFVCFDRWLRRFQNIYPLTKYYYIIERVYFIHNLFILFISTFSFLVFLQTVSCSILSGILYKRDYLHARVDILFKLCSNYVSLSLYIYIHIYTLYIHIHTYIHIPIYIYIYIYIYIIYNIYMWDIGEKKFTDFNALLSIVNSILSLVSGNYLLDLHDFMHYG